MSSNPSFHSSKINVDDNMISLLPECFVSQYPSRKVVHYSSKQFHSNIHNNITDFKPNNKSKCDVQFRVTQTSQLQNSNIKHTKVILNKGSEIYEESIDTDEGRSPNFSDVDDINNISYFILDEPESED